MSLYFATYNTIVFKIIYGAKVSRKKRSSVLLWKLPAECILVACGELEPLIVSLCILIGCMSTGMHYSLVACFDLKGLQMV